MNSFITALLETLPDEALRHLLLQSGIPHEELESLPLSFVREALKHQANGGCKHCNGEGCADMPPSGECHEVTLRHTDDGKQRVCHTVTKVGPFEGDFHAEAEAARQELARFCQAFQEKRAECADVEQREEELQNTYQPDWAIFLNDLTCEVLALLDEDPENLTPTTLIITDEEGAISLYKNRVNGRDKLCDLTGENAAALLQRYNALATQHQEIQNCKARRHDLERLLPTMQESIDARAEKFQVMVKKHHPELTIAAIAVRGDDIEVHVVNQHEEEGDTLSPDVQRLLEKNKDSISPKAWEMLQSFSSANGENS